MHRGTGESQTAGHETRPKVASPDLLLREINHRCSNDLQLVVSLLSLQSRRAATPESREALEDAAQRVAILAEARSMLQHQDEDSLETALRKTCEALQSQAEPRGILVALAVGEQPTGLSSSKIMTLALAVNELATNAIKHAFEEGKSGYVHISLRQNDDHGIIICVDDDGLPFPEVSDGGGSGFGLGLVNRLVASIGGLLIMPTNGSKIFEIRVPL